VVLSSDELQVFIERVGAGLVAINTENPPGRELEAASFFAEKAAELGYKARVVRHFDGRASALVEGEWGDGRTIVFNSHLDTVPAGPIERWIYHPFNTGVRNGFLFGRGSVDAKGCLTSMLAALAMVRDSPKLSGRFLLMAVADEEVGGLGTLALLKEVGHVDYAVVGEPSSLKICLSSRGRVEILVEIFGKPAHASTPEKGVNAVTAAAKAAVSLSKLEKGFGKEVKFLGRSTAAVTVFEGGLKSNVIPDHSSFKVDYRTVRETPEQALRFIKEQVEKVLPRKTSFKASITSAVPSFRLDENSKLVEVCRRAVRDSGLRPQLIGFKAVTDLSRMAAKLRGLEGVIIGPGDLGLAHSFDERVAIKELMKAAEIYYKILRYLMLDS